MLTRLPPLLSVIAGMVDVIGYFSLGNLFTAHVTGNIVVIAATLVRGGSQTVAQLLAVPMFVVALAVIWLLARVSDWRSTALLRPLLGVQLFLLVCVLALSVAFHVFAAPEAPAAGAAAMLATSAMACQFALLRLAVPGAPSTAVMTGNLTNAVLSALDRVPWGQPIMASDDERLKRTAFLLAGFFVGCVVGAAAVSLLGDWSWSLPVVLAAAAIALCSR